MITEGFIVTIIVIGGGIVGITGGIVGGLVGGGIVGGIV